MIHHYGLAVDPEPTNYGTTIFAELVPATPLITWQGFSRPSWRKYWPLGIGRSWREPHIRWWYEIHETGDTTKKFPDNIGTHWYKHDGGATTLRGALWRAGEAVDKAVKLAGMETPNDQL